jgi:hypothetical protein
MYVETPLWVLMCSMLVISVVGWYTIDYVTNGGQRQAGAVCTKEIRTCNLINTMQVYQYGDKFTDCILHVCTSVIDSYSPT